MSNYPQDTNDPLIKLVAKCANGCHIYACILRKIAVFARDLEDAKRGLGHFESDPNFSYIGDKHEGWLTGYGAITPEDIRKILGEDCTTLNHQQSVGRAKRIKPDEHKGWQPDVPKDGVFDNGIINT